MSRLRIGIVRYSSVADAIGRALGIDPPPDIRIGQGRITLTLRSLGATRWSEAKQIDEALKIAVTARAVLAADTRRSVKKRALDRAIVVVFEDATLIKGCSVIAEWKCVVPADSPQA